MIFAYKAEFAQQLLATLEQLQTVTYLSMPGADVYLPNTLDVRGTGVLLSSASHDTESAFPQEWQI